MFEKVKKVISNLLKTKPRGKGSPGKEDTQDKSYLSKLSEIKGIDYSEFDEVFEYGSTISEVIDNLDKIYDECNISYLDYNSFEEVKNFLWANNYDTLPWYRELISFILANNPIVVDQMVSMLDEKHEVGDLGIQHVSAVVSNHVAEPNTVSIVQCLEDYIKYVTKLELLDKGILDKPSSEISEDEPSIESDNTEDVDDSIQELDSKEDEIEDSDKPVSFNEEELFTQDDLIDVDDSTYTVELIEAVNKN